MAVWTPFRRQDEFVFSMTTDYLKHILIRTPLETAARGRRLDSRLGETSYAACSTSRRPARRRRRSVRAPMRGSGKDASPTTRLAAGRARSSFVIRRSVFSGLAKKRVRKHLNWLSSLRHGPNH